MDDLEIAFFRAFGPAEVSRERLAKLRLEFEAVHLPLAKALGVLAKQDSVSDLAARYWQTAGEVSSVAPAKEQADALLVTAAGWLDSAEDFDPDTEPDDSFWRQVATSASSLMTHTFGYLVALRDVRSDTVRRGANGRRLIGATTRANARRAAEPHRGRMSRDAAATLIADQIGKSPSRIRRLLSEEYPGATWDDPDVSVSTDPPRQDD